MSQVLGPVHYWQYGKIGRVDARFEALHESGHRLFGVEADRLYAEAILAYGKPHGETALEDWITEAGIHASLWGMLRAAELREATYIKGLIELFGEPAEEMALSVWVRQGKQLGLAARKELPESGRADIVAKMLWNVYADGMPCDERDRVVEESAARYVWEATHRLHREIWQEAGVDADVMSRLYGHWFRAFIRSLAAGCHFLVDETVTPSRYVIMAVKA